MDGTESRPLAAGRHVGTGSATVEVIHAGDAILLSGAVVARFPADAAAEALAAAVDACPDGGLIALGTGTFALAAPVVVDRRVTLAGAGAATILVPPPGDFALKVGATPRSPLRREIIRDAAPELYAMEDRTYGIVVRDLAIDGHGRGKGLSVEFLIEGAFANLSIHRTTDGAGLRLGPSVMETTFRDLHLLDCGSAREAAVSIEAQATGDSCNNVLFDAVFVIFPNGVAMEIGAGTGAQVPRLVALRDCMMHGWLPPARSAEAPLLKVKAIDFSRGLRVRGGRFTCAGAGQPYVALLAGQAAFTGVSFGGGNASCAVMSRPGTDLSLRDCTFHGSRGRAADGRDRPGDVAHVGGTLLFDGNLCQARAGRLVVAESAAVVATGNRILAQRPFLVLHGAAPEARFRAGGNILAPTAADPAGLLAAGGIVLSDSA